MGLCFSYKGEKCDAFNDHHEIVDTKNGVQVSLRGQADGRKMNEGCCDLVRQWKKAHLEPLKQLGKSIGHKNKFQMQELWLREKPEALEKGVADES